MQGQRRVPPHTRARGARLRRRTSNVDRRPQSRQPPRPQRHVRTTRAFSCEARLSEDSHPGTSSYRASSAATPCSTAPKTTPPTSPPEHPAASNGKPPFAPTPRYSPPLHDPRRAGAPSSLRTRQACKGHDAPNSAPRLPLALCVHAVATTKARHGPWPTLELDAPARIPTALQGVFREKGCPVFEFGP